MRRLGMGAVLLGLVTAAAPAWAGWIIDETVRGGGGGKTGAQRQRVVIQANRLKTVSYEGTRPTEAMIMDLDAQTITHIDYKERAYVSATAREYAAAMSQGLEMMGEAMQGQMKDQMKEMQEALKDLPPEQRRQMEAMMKAAQQGAKQQGTPKLKAEDCKPDKVDIKTMGSRVTVAGYDASGYQIFTNGTLESEVWIAPAITAVRELDPQKLERMVADMLKALPQCPPSGRSGIIGADPVWKLMKDGYPVRSVEKSDGGVTEVVKAESRSLGANEFQAPAGFARKTLQEMMGGK